jgi:hypothetical protein
MTWAKGEILSHHPSEFTICEWSGRLCVEIVATKKGNAKFSTDGGYQIFERWEISNFNGIGNIKFSRDVEYQTLQRMRMSRFSRNGEY